MILDNIIFTKELQKYFNDISLEPNIEPTIKPYVNIIDNYRNEQKLFILESIRYKFRSSGSFVISCLGIDINNKIINITNKILSYFSIMNYLPSMDLHNIIETYNELVTDINYEIVEEEVFLCIDCFPFAPVHNLDDIYNLLYFYKKNNLKCKLAVIKTDNFYYNQSLISLQKYFKLEYIYLEFNKNYLFKKLLCTRQYHWLQKEAHEFIRKEYIEKIIENNKDKPYFKNLSILKYETPHNVSNLDTFSKSEIYDNFCETKNIIDLNLYNNDLEYKIYLINKAEKIITGYLSPYNVNIYKHCSDFTNKEIILINGGNNKQENNLNKHFNKIGENLYISYINKIKIYIFDDIPNLNIAVMKIYDIFL